MPDPRHEHGSGVRPVGEPPGGRALNPAGYSSGVHALPAEHADPPQRPRRRRRVPPERGRPQRREVGSKNRPPPTEDMLRAPPDAE